MLANPTYRRLFGAQVVALLGTGLLTVALSLLAFDVAPTSAGVVLATALTIKIVAYVVGAPLMTAVTVRFAPRTVLVTADVARLLVALALPWVDEVWHVYALILVLQLASATFTPTFQALIPEVLPDREDYTRALSYSRLAYDLEAVASPVLAAGLLVVMSYHGLFVGTGLGFLLSAALVLRAGLAGAPTRTDDTPFVGRLTRGLRLFATVPQLRALLALDLVVAAATAVILVNTVVVVRGELGLGETAVALVLGASGLGSMAVALAMPAILRVTTVRLAVLASGWLVALGLLAAVVATSAGSVTAVAAAWVLLGAATSGVMTPAGRVVNEAVSERDRPATFAASFSLSHAWFLIAYPLAGWIGSAWDVSTSAAVLGVVALAASGAASWLWRPTSEPSTP